jgi:hypothetical protein
MKTFTIYLQSLVNPTKDFDSENPEVFTTEYTINADTYYEATQIAKQQHNLSVWESWGEEKLIEIEPIKTTNLTFANDDLSLIIDALSTAYYDAKSRGYNNSNEYRRIELNIRKVLTPEVFADYSNSILMNS